MQKNVSRSSVRMVRGQVHSVLRKGDIIVKLRNGEIKDIIDVLYMPALKPNLLSVGILVDKGYSVKFDATTCIMPRRIDPAKKNASLTST